MYYIQDYGLGHRLLGEVNFLPTRDNWQDVVVKSPPANAERGGFDPWVGKIPWIRKWQPTLVFLLGKFHRETQ